MLILSYAVLSRNNVCTFRQTFHRMRYKIPRSYCVVCTACKTPSDNVSFHREVPRKNQLRMAGEHPRRMGKVPIVFSETKIQMCWIPGFKIQPTPQTLTETPMTTIPRRRRCKASWTTPSWWRSPTSSGATWPGWRPPRRRSRRPSSFPSSSLTCLQVYFFALDPEAWVLRQALVFYHM